MEVDNTNLRMESGITSGSGSAGSRDSIDSSDTYSKYGITNIPKTTVTTAIGQTKTCVGLSYKEWGFLVLTTVNILTAIGLTTYRLVTVIDHHETKTPDFTFIILLLLNAGFCLFYAIHGVLRERVYEMYALMAAVLVVMVYCIVEYSLSDGTSRSTLKLVRLILICSFAPPNMILAYFVAKHFGYLQFRIVGASEYLQYLYNQASLFSCLLKFDVQVTGSIVVLVLRNGTEVKLYEQIILGVGIPYALMWNILGWFVLRKELAKGAVVFAVLGFAKPAYYIFKIVQEYIDIKDKNSKGENLEETIIYSTLAAALLALLVWVILMFELYKVYKNFGKGLKERAYDVLSSEHTSLITGRRLRR